MPTKMKKNNLGGILALLAFAVFAVCVLMILLNGADIVKRVSERDKESFEDRTAAQYISMRIRQADQKDGISVREDEQSDFLVFSEEIDGEIYETLVYCYDGYLCELFCQGGLEPETEFGEKIIPAKNLNAEMMGDGIFVEITSADGDSQQLTFALRSGRGDSA